MNLIGKIFVVLILVMSLVFMTLAAMVLGTHTNWFEVVNNPVSGLKIQLQQADIALANATTQREQLQRDLDNEKAARDRAVAKLTTQASDLQKERDQLQNEQAGWVQRVDDATTAMNATQKTLEALRAEVESQREVVATSRKERDDFQNASIKLEDELAQAKGEWDRLKRTNERLLIDVNKIQLAFQEAGIQLNQDGPPQVAGFITQSRDNGLVEINLGSDDGLQAGHELIVYRMGPTAETSQFLGKVKILRTEPDTAVAQEIPGMKRGTIQKEDRVATKLR